MMPLPSPMPVRQVSGHAATLIAILALGLGACASTPIDVEESGVIVEPVAAAQVAESPELARGTVLWGGTIIGASNLASGSQLEVIAYPLDRTQRPQGGRPSQGRFLVASDDYLEPLDYAEGREITVLGTLDGLDEVTVGEARRQFPVVRPSEMHLWTGERARPGTGFTFGIGVGSGGRTSGGIGIGIGG